MPRLSVTGSTARVSAADSHLRRARGLPNLRLCTRACVDKLLIGEAAAGGGALAVSGVALADGRVVRARREVLA